MFRVLNGMCFAFSVYQVPEDDEVFSVRLTGVAGGALLKPNASSVRLRILRNDSPLRFSHTVMAVPESAAVIALNVTRGRLTEDGPLIGSVDTEVVFFKPSFSCLHSLLLQKHSYTHNQQLICRENREHLSNLYETSGLYCL